ncbi:hypothetical protein GCM10007028_25780 [Algibacter mikhailovii]|uniref:Uncharacterized protein n=1 Tax=Algibacter mikhailovii TaxID=425498 RepID=A0A918VCG1_9FLAO|nr:hypothetical protein GCM10007028_25780 [Algibacter mikhailovii]
MLPIIKTINPQYTNGFLPKLSDSGPNINCPKPNPKKIIVISNWLSVLFIMFKCLPISGKAGNKASMDSATIDIKEAISATNSNLKLCGLFMWQI